MPVPGGRRGAAALLAALLLAGCVRVFAVPIGGVGAGEGVEEGAPAAQPGGEARAAGDLANRHRAARGCPPLRWDDRAALAAQRHSDDMASRGFFSHTGSDGSEVGDRVRRAGAQWARVAENIARVPGGTAESVVRGWLNSSGHRANIEDCRLTHHGVGIRGDRWTHVFFTPAGE